ncbi:MAG: hypothetical protein QNJ13_15275 [Paracoccaceae bacterium]|nr:hypothetical protein [Paracoccaceae bacterium]
MSQYEFKIVPAPRKGLGRAIFRRDPKAMSLAEAVNALADEGWTFLRSDHLPFPAPIGLFVGLTMRREVMVFQRPRRRTPSRALGLGRAPATNPQAFHRDMTDLLGGFQPLNFARAA